MKCAQVQELLSAYVDDELPAGERTAVAGHVRTCAACSEELAVFERMSTLAGELRQPRPPEGIWDALEAALDAEHSEPVLVANGTSERGRVGRRWRLGALATAALLLVAVGGTWLTTATWRGLGDERKNAVDFNEYVQSFPRDPQSAQDVLLATYGGRSVDVDEATRQLGYQPKVAAGLPAGYSLQSMYVLDMPCCKCVKSLCRRDDGKLFAIFEHEEGQPVSFGDRPRIDTQCNGCPCSVMGTESGLVASWKSDKRQLTVVGAVDLEEVTDLIKHLQQTAPET